ncbi:WD40/YVTN/BNR-like repeat-containing protein [Pseudoalteromonas mariniglutinosa]|uniref:WD40/YVTN/BNR-like repeat-containing protein n=1 Tax=Pseudoalteromonas mariniglutinosa TaxID=206042 RepID=UPI00384E57CE
MKYLLYACLAYSASSLAQDIPSPQSAFSAVNADKTLLTDIEYTGKQLVAVGKHGVIITSSDGEDWQQANVPTQTLLTAVDFYDQQTGWACGHDATIINSNDGGANWQLQQFLPTLDKPCLDILFLDQNKGFAVGAYGMFYETSNAGKTWQKRFLDSLLFSEDRAYLNDLKESDPQGYEAETASILPHFNRIVKVADKLVLAGEMGLLGESIDGGKTWQRLDEIYMGSFFAFASTAPQQGEDLVAGLRGNIFTRQAGSDEWVQIANDTHATVNSVIKYNNNEWLLLANSGVIFHLSNNQLSSEQMADGKALLDGVIFQDKLLMVSENGIKVKELTP